MGGPSSSTSWDRRIIWKWSYCQNVSNRYISLYLPLTFWSYIPLSLDLSLQVFPLHLPWPLTFAETIVIVLVFSTFFAIAIDLRYFPQPLHCYWRGVIVIAIVIDFTIAKLPFSLPFQLPFPPSFPFSSLWSSPLRLALSKAHAIVITIAFVFPSVFPNEQCLTRKLDWTGGRTDRKP